MGIWSIMGVSFYRELYPDEFGSFFKGMLSMLQIMSFDSWSFGITRPVILNDETNDVLGGIFFIAYVFASAIIMANVVLAILIDKFLSTAKALQKEDEAELAALKQGQGEIVVEQHVHAFSEEMSHQIQDLLRQASYFLDEFYDPHNADVENGTDDTEAYSTKESMEP